MNAEELKAIERKIRRKGLKSLSHEELTTLFTLAAKQEMDSLKRLFDATTVRRRAHEELTSRER